MSTQERIKFDARLWENCFNADPEDAYVAGALSERNKVIEEIREEIEKRIEACGNTVASLPDELTHTKISSEAMMSAYKVTIQLLDSLTPKK